MEMEDALHIFQAVGACNTWHSGPYPNCTRWVPNKMFLCIDRSDRWVQKVKGGGYVSTSNPHFSALISFPDTYVTSLVPY